MNILYTILGEILRFIYNFTNNFGWAIVVFTILVRLCMLPLTIKQQKSMDNMNKVQPELAKLQKKYANDKDKLNEETMKLYQKYNVNPMGGCLPLLIQMPILFAIYGVIQNPITYVLKLKPSVEVLTALCQKPTDTQLEVVCFVSNQFEKALDALSNAGLSFNLESLKMNFNFLGLNLGYTPQSNVDLWLYLIPILSIVTSFLVNKVGQPKKDDSKNNDQPNQMQTMQYIFPFMTGYFCYILPAAMGLYWIMGNILQIGQTYLMRAIKKKSNNDDVLIVEPEKKKKKK